MTVLALVALMILDRLGPHDTAEGEFRVIDGDSLGHREGEIRLHGIDAPELAQDCRDPQGSAYPCGRRARDHLQSLVAGRAVACTTLDVDRYRRRVARCLAGGDDLGREMVAAGWAVAYTVRARDYVGAEAEARRARRGLWAGEFEPPGDWRRRHAASRADAAGDMLPPD